MKKRSVIIIVLTASLLVLLPYLILGRNAHIPVHDNLNQLNMLGIFDGKYQGTVAPWSEIREFTLPGTEKLFHLTQAKLDKLLFSKDYFNGFVINELLYRLLGLLGMVLLLKKHLLTGRLPDMLVLLTGTAFILLPFWPQGNMSVAGLPLVLYSILNLQKRRLILVSYFLIALYAFYSNFFFTGIYLLIFMAMLFFIRILKSDFNFHLLGGLALMFISAIISHYPVFLNFFIERIPTNRIDQDLPVKNLWEAAGTAWRFFCGSDLLATSHHKFTILPAGIIIICLRFLRRESKRISSLLLILLIAGLFSLIGGFYFFAPFLSVYKAMQIGFNFSRIYVLNSFLWYLLLSYICYQLLDIFKFKKAAYAIVYGLVFLQIAVNTGFYLKRGFSANPGFASFVAEEQFREIRQELDLESEIRIGCIGFFPAVANYNGFMTIGSFSAYYPMSYKNKFRRIISHELDKNPELKDYFDRRGSALLLFDDEIGRYYQDQDYLRKNIPSINSELDFGLIRSLNVEYIFSTCEIINAASAGLKMVYLSDNVDHYYRIYVYKLI